MGAPQLGNCPKCRKLYLRIRNICDDCFQKQEEEYIKTAAYLRDYPGSTIQEVSDATEVSVAQIRQFILAGRILVGHFPNLSYPCESCGDMIRTGRKCSNCIDTLNQLASQMKQLEENQNSGPTRKSGGYISHK